VPLSIDAGGAALGPGAYLVLGSASGTTPGTALGSILDLRPGRSVVPLNTGPFLSWSLASVNTPPFQSTRGFLDADGRAEAAFVPAPGDLTPWIGNRIEWSALLSGPNGYTATATAGFDVVP
jgi:hypothetical protein